MLNIGSVHLNLFYMQPKRFNVLLFLFPEATAPAERVADKLVQTSSECVHKLPIEKPQRASVDRATPNQDAASKSPPPAPPRRLPLTATGLTTGRSGEVIFTSRKDPAPPQVCVTVRPGFATFPDIFLSLKT